MALSNWDTLAFDSDGKPCNGVLVGLSEKAWVEIYKNWIYVHDEREWRDGGQWVKDVISQVEDGHVRISDFNISSIRGPQESILVYVESVKYPDVKEGEKQIRLVRRMAGIGCYGFSDPTEIWLKNHNITLGPGDHCCHGSSSGPDGQYLALEVFRKDMPGIEEYTVPRTPENEEIYDAKWVGVEPETLKALIDFLKEEHDFDSKYCDRDVHEWIEKIEKEVPLRFNQGDQYFARRLGTDTPATKIGSASVPTLLQVFKEHFNEEPVRSDQGKTGGNHPTDQGPPMA